MSESKVKRIPAHDLGRINQWRNKLYMRFMERKFLERVLDPPDFDELVALVTQVLKIPDEFAVRQTLMEFAGQEFVGRTCELICLKLAGGLKLLREGTPVAGRISGPTWLPVEITDLRYGAVRRGKTYVRMTATVMAGEAAGMEIRKEFSYKMAVWTLANALAWNKRDHRPVHNEMVRMWFMGLIVPSDDGFDIQEFECVPHHRKWNKKLRAARATPCVRKLRQKCHTCPVGYLDCKRGTHRYTLSIKRCKRCNQEHAAFDPEQSHIGLCVACQTKDARANWARERAGWN